MGAGRYAGRSYQRHPLPQARRHRMTNGLGPSPQREVATPRTEASDHPLGAGTESVEEAPSALCVGAVTPNPSGQEDGDAARGGLPRQIRAGKNTLVYNVHSYSTKVPYQAILRFISHFTKPGDVVLDPFCGSGMTGVAAVLLGRNAVLVDISPAAIHIASNYVTPCEAAALGALAEIVIATAAAEVAPLYETSCDRCGGPATVEYTVWSDVFACAECCGDIRYWDAALDRKTGAVRPTLTCAHCGACATKADLAWRRSVPVSTKYSCKAACGRLTERPTTPAEIALSARIEAEPVTDWCPSDPFGPEREMWRKSHEVMGITSVEGFYTRRNLRALAVLWREIERVPDTRLRSALRFAFTGIVNRASRRYQWNAKRPTNVQTGTLYIASLNYEWNVLSLFRRKLRDVLAYYRAHPHFPGQAVVLRDSAVVLKDLAENSVDYVFTDPPFGANIYYADCALLWESWLGEHTDERLEILIHRKRRERGGNSLHDYQRLLAEAFTRVYQVLKPGRWASVVFHSSDAAIWRAVQESLRDAGLELVNTTGLDKGQPSIKGLKGKRGKERVAAVDVILNLRKPSRMIAPAPFSREHADVKGFLLEILSEHLHALPSRILHDPQTFSNEMRRMQHLHSLAVRALLEHHVPFKNVSFAYVEALCQEHFELRGEQWYLRGETTGSDRGPFQLDLLEHVAR